MRQVAYQILDKFCIQKAEGARAKCTGCTAMRHAPPQHVDGVLYHADRALWPASLDCTPFDAIRHAPPCVVDMVCTAKPHHAPP
jgi:hypothetical protein